MESFLKLVVALVLVQQAIAIRYIRPPITRICPLHQKYNACGSACPLTCDNYENPPQMCTMNCVVGCECEAGYVKNTANGSCCLREECPATTPAPGPVCPLNQEYSDCGSACPLTCENYKNPPQMCTDNCVIGCQCKSGFVKKADGSCCLTAEC